MENSKNDLTSTTSTATTTKKQILDEETKRKNELLLQEIEKASAQASKFFKFQDGEHKTLRMLPHLTEPTYVTYPSNPGEKVQRYRFVAFEQVLDDQNGTLRDATSEPKEWTVSVSVAKDLIKWINKGYFVLDITREGNSLSTKYAITPYVD
jgi:hypothetical protein